MGNPKRHTGAAVAEITAKHVSENLITAKAGEPRIYNFGTIHDLEAQVAETIEEAA